MTKKFISLSLAALIALLCSLSLNTVALDDPDENIVSDIYYDIYYDENGVQHKRILDENGNEIELEHNNKLTENDIPDLPAAYDSRDYDRVTSVKNQNPFGSCWSFAFCAAAESSLISQGYATKDTIDLSEAHLLWFRGQSNAANASTPADLDYWLSHNESTFDYGGNSYEAAAMIARWNGFALESDFPYSRTEANMNFDSADRYRSDYQLVSSVNYTNSDMPTVKEKIMESGALATALYYDDSYLKNSANGYCYYQNVTDGTNHAITVVGWDDNYSASNFITAPAGNGAWLIKNSWNTNWGDGGYFWLSYYDTSVTEFTHVVAVPAGEYEMNYQYDGAACLAGTSYGNNTIYGANIFTASEDGRISAAGFTHVWNACTCTVSLYTNLKPVSGSYNKPTNGTLCESKTIYVQREGYYTVKFDNSYPISAGEHFSIVIQYNGNNSSYAYITCEISPADPSTEYHYTSSSGQSFISSSKISWTDLYSKSLGNLPIKAFTETPAAVSSVSIKSMPTKTQYYLGETLDTSGLVLTAAYSDGTTQDISSGFTCSPSTLNTIGTQEITVSFEGFTAVFNVTVLSNIAGDSDADGEISLMDVVLITRYIAGGWDIVINIDNADVNNDGVLSLKDAVLIRRYIAGGWGVILV